MMFRPMRRIRQQISEEECIRILNERNLSYSFVGRGPMTGSMKGQAFHTSFVPLKRHKWDSTLAALSQSMEGLRHQVKTCEGALILPRTIQK